MQKLFYELILVALDRKERLSQNPSGQEWNVMFDMAKKQAVAGIAFLALDRLSQVGQKPPLPLLYEWIGLSEQIKNQNLIVSQRCKDITRLFSDAGFHSCILKGQGNAMMYPEPLARTSGDIDIWVYGQREKVTEFVKKRCPEAFEQYLHIDFPIYNDVSVEVHYTSGRLLAPKYNKRFQEWCDNYKRNDILQVDDSLGFNIPTVEFNVVHQMMHIMTHFFVEGIGLRHFIDYYYVLKELQKRNCSEDFEKQFKYFGMLKFAQGVMWLEKEVLGLEDELLIVSPDERLGRVILREMEEGGNFGHYDARYTGRNNGILLRGLTDSYRLLKLAYYFPHDSLWKLARKVENQKWKIRGMKAEG